MSSQNNENTEKPQPFISTNKEKKRITPFEQGIHQANP